MPFPLKHPPSLPNTTSFALTHVMPFCPISSKNLSFEPIDITCLSSLTTLMEEIRYALNGTWKLVLLTVADRALHLLILRSVSEERDE